MLTAESMVLERRKQHIATPINYLAGRLENCEGQNGGRVR